MAPCRISRRRAQKGREPRGSASVEGALRPASQTGDFGERALGRGVLSLLEHERLDAKQRELSPKRSERVRIFLHGVADKDERSDLRALGFIARMRKHPLYLRRPAADFNAAHKLSEPLSAGDEVRRSAFVQPTKIDELH